MNDSYTAREHILIFSYASSSILYSREWVGQWVIVSGCNLLAQLGACELVWICLRGIFRKQTDDDWWKFDGVVSDLSGDVSGDHQHQLPVYFKRCSFKNASICFQKTQWWRLAEVWWCCWWCSWWSPAPAAWLFSPPTSRPCPSPRRTSSPGRQKCPISTANRMFYQADPVAGINNGVGHLGPMLRLPACSLFWPKCSLGGNCLLHIPIQVGFYYGRR